MTGMKKENKMSVLSDLEPKQVFHYFEEISGIPRGSYHEKQISDYLVCFAKEHGFTVYQDDLYNVVMLVPGSKGREAEEALILQGHMDMVCEKTEDADIDMEKEGLSLLVDGDFVKAKDTTLGGDDGIAVAYMLAIADDSGISHPPLEYIITVSEEVGMEGASGIDLSMLTGHQMLNLDSEEEGIFLSSCAGGLSTKSCIPVSRWETEDLQWCTVTVGGLLGGHSGCEIHKERGNSNKLIARVLYELDMECDICLFDLEGGQKDNVIPLLTKAVVGVKHQDVEKRNALISRLDATLKAEYSKSDAGVYVSAEELESGKKLGITKESFNRVLSVLIGLPNGVQNMSMDVPDLVETSLNLGVMKLEEKQLCLRHAIRSSVTSRKYYVASQVECLVEAFGGTVSRQGEYPAWEYREESVVRPKVVDLYERMFGRVPEVKGIHAGLECGLLAGKISDLDCVSMGPDILDIHTTSERLSISSTKRMYDFLIEYLK